MNLIDLTHPIQSGMPVYPGDPETALFAHRQYGDGGYLTGALSMGAHCGTHIDMPLHRLAGTQPVDQAPLERFVLRCAVVDVPAGRDAQPCDLEPARERIGACPGVLLRSGWSRQYGSPAFFEGHPGVSPSAAEWLCDRGITLLGLETPSAHATLHKEVHDAFFRRDVIILESLAGLTALPAEITLAAVPLRLEGLEASPVRAFAIIGQRNEGSAKACFCIAE